MDFGLLYENDEGEYMGLNDVCVADIRLASLVYVSKYCVPIELLRQNKPISITLFGPHPNKKARVSLRVPCFSKSLFTIADLLAVRYLWVVCNKDKCRVVTQRAADIRVT